MSDDLFADMENTKDAFEEQAKPAAAVRTQAKKENYWDKVDIQPLELDVSKFSKKGKSFAVFVHPDNDVPEDVFKKLVTVAKVCMEKGYTFRHTGDKDNVLHNTIVKLEGAKVVSYMPWKKFNPDAINPIMSNPIGYRIAITVHRAFMKLPAAVRAILSKDTIALLGEDATDPVDFVLAWNDGGDEAITRKSEFKKIGNNTFILQVCGKANIPVLNAYNATFLDRLKEAIGVSD